MSQKNNDSIEDFFRKAVRQDDDITFRESDWKNMEKLLDEHPMTDARAVRQSMRRIVGAATVLVLLFGVSIYLVVFRNSSESTAQVTEATVKPDQQFPSTESLKPSTGSLKEEETGSEPQTESPDEISVDHSPGQKVMRDQSSAGETEFSSAKKRVHSGSQNSPPAEHVSKPKATDASEGTKISNFTSSSTVNSTNVGTAEKSESPAFNSSLNSSTKNPSVSPIVNSLAGDPNKTGDENDNIDGSVVQPVGTAITPSVSKNSQTEKTVEASDIVTTDSSKTEVLTNASLATAPDKAEKQDEEKEQHVVAKRWSVAVVIAPDFSLTGGSNVTAPGEAFGFLIGYRMTKRFTLSTGLLRTSKKYVGTGEDYHPPKGYWRNRTNGIVPSEIYGQCAVIEIPVWVQFDLMLKPKYRIYLTGGASSYRMLSESYSYTFDQPNEGAEDGWSSSEPSSHLFAVGHLSAGYERNVFRRFSLGIEPYVKAPFGGIGWSDVQLYTLGVYVNGRYRF